MSKLRSILTAASLLGFVASSFYLFVFEWWTV